jgi:hypothetical protein
MKNLKTLSAINFGVLIVAVLFFYITHSVVNVYKYKLIGALCEMLWLPSLFAIILCPVIAITLFIKEKFAFNLFNVLSILTAVVFLFFVKW